MQALRHAPRSATGELRPTLSERFRPLSGQRRRVKRHCALGHTWEPIIAETTFEHLALALWSAACSCVVLLLVFLLVASVPAGELGARNKAATATPASAREAEIKQPASSMLVASGYAIAKGKLD